MPHLATYGKRKCFDALFSQPLQGSCLDLATCVKNKCIYTNDLQRRCATYGEKMGFTWHHFHQPGELMELS